MSKKKPVKFLEAKRVYLRPLTKKDIPLLQRWVNDPEVRQYLNRYLPAMKAEEEELLERIHKDRERHIVLMICLTEGDKPIGTMGIHNMNLKDGIATTGAMIGEKEYWGKGYGTEAKMILLHHAFTNLNLRKVYSAVISFNKRSWAYLEKTGYRVVGIYKKDVFRNNRYYDLVLLEVWKVDFMKIWRKYKKKHLS